MGDNLSSGACVSPGKLPEEQVARTLGLSFHSEETLLLIYLFEFLDVVFISDGEVSNTTNLLAGNRYPISRSDQLSRLAGPWKICRPTVADALRDRRQSIVQYE